MTLIILASLLFSSLGQQGQLLGSGRQVSAEEVLSLLQSADPNQKGEALVALTDTPVLRQDARLRQAVLDELRKARVAYVNRRQSDETRSDHRSGELLLALIRTAAKFDGPDVVTALLPHLGQSAVAQRRVAASGSAAIEALLQQYESGVGASEPESVRFGALKTLAEITVHNTLSQKQRSSVEQVAAEALKSQEMFVYAGGIYLGAATRRPDLIDAAVKAQAGEFGGRRLSESDSRYLRGVGQRALAQAGIAVR
jgi:hypothetical protein